MTPWDSSLLFAHCCGGQLTVAGETETSAIWFSFKWKYWPGLVRVTALPRLPRSVSAVNCLEEFRSPAEVSNTPTALQRQGQEDPSCAAKDNSQGLCLEGCRHIQSDAFNFFISACQKKILIYLPHMSAWALNVHWNQNSETFYECNALKMWSLNELNSSPFSSVL